MSETPSEYTAQEADAEGVRPLSEAEETDYRERLAYFELNISTSNGQAALDEVLWLAQASRQALATLDAARAELERKDAEAAALRDAAELAYSWMNDWDASRHDETCYGDKPLVRSKLDNTQAGADLLERVRQLEGYLAVCEEQYQAAWVAERRENERLQVWRDAVVEYVDAAHPEKGGPYVKARAYERLWGLVIQYRKDHQGTGAAGEEGEC